LEKRARRSNHISAGMGRCGMDPRRAEKEAVPSQLTHQRVNHIRHENLGDQGSGPDQGGLHGTKARTRKPEKKRPDVMGKGASDAQKKKHGLEKKKKEDHMWVKMKESWWNMEKRKR